MRPRRLSQAYDRAAKRADQKQDAGAAERATRRRELSDLAWGVGQEHHDLFIREGGKR